MKSVWGLLTKDISLTLAVFFLLALSISILKSIAPSIFPAYYIYMAIALIAFWFFSNVSFDILSLFSSHLYVLSIILLLLTLIIGQVTRGTIRWIPLGSLRLQPGELVRPFLLVFFANYLGSGLIDIKRILKALALLALPVFAILIQPSLGVSIITIIGFIGIVLASNFNKKYILVVAVILIALIPLFWNLMAPYQRQRILTFTNPAADPLGSGYNSLQSTIAAGAGEIFGRGLGKGIQTQLSFLPEKQTDFVFAAIGEELGFVGTSLLLIASFLILFRLTLFMEKSINSKARAYISGFFLIYVVQLFIHVGMNMGLIPVTGLPFPLVSAGGSSLLATMTGLGIAVGAYRKG